MRKEFSVGDPSGFDLMTAARRRDPDTTHGADGWRTRELEALPLSFWDRVAEVFTAARVAGLVPEGLAVVLHPVIPKPSRFTRPGLPSRTAALAL
eukprot:11041626-Karenia_brevis.AAC.1